MNEQIETFLRTLNLMYPGHTVCVLVNERGTAEVKMASNLPSEDLTKSFVRDIAGVLETSIINLKKLN